MRLPRSAGACGVAVAVLLTACGRDGDDALAWSNKVCGVMVDFRNAIYAAAPDGTAADVAVRARQLSEFTGKALASTRTALADLAAAGAAPVQGGDAVIATLKERITRIQTTFATVKSHVDAVDPAAPQADTALVAAVAPLQSLTELPDPTAQLAANPDLQMAVDAAPNCQALRGNDRNVGGG